MRFGLRLAKDLKHLDFARYEHAARSLDEVGRLVGGWLKAQPGTRTAPETQSANHAAQTPPPV